MSAPVDIRAGSHDPHGIRRLYFSVSSRNGPTRTIDVHDAAVSAGLAQDGYEIAYRMVCQRGWMTLLAI